LIADRPVIGTVLSVDREPYEVIGVMNAEFEPGFFPAQVWIPPVSLTFAHRFWPDQDPIGRRIRRAGDHNPWMTIVGVVGDVRDYDLGVAPEPMLYIPFAQFNTRVAPIMVVVRASTGDPLGLVPDIRRAILSLDPL
jgi:hypothetical protein